MATFRKAYDENPNNFNENFFLGMALLPGWTETGGGAEVEESRRA